MGADRFLGALSSSFTTSLGINVLIKHLHPESRGVPHTVGEEMEGQIYTWVRGCITPRLLLQEWPQAEVL